MINPATALALNPFRAALEAPTFLVLVSLVGLVVTVPKTKKNALIIQTLNSLQMVCDTAYFKNVTDCVKMVEILRCLK